MDVAFQEFALVAKIFLFNKRNVAAVLWEIYRLKNVLKGTILSQADKRIIVPFDKIGDLKVHLRRGRKLTHSYVTEDVYRTIAEQSNDDVVGCNRALAVWRHLGVPYFTMRNVLRKIAHFYSYKICYNQQLL